jgi:hypothetical protein
MKEMGLAPPHIFNDMLDSPALLGRAQKGPPFTSFRMA